MKEDKMKTGKAKGGLNYFTYQALAAGSAATVGMLSSMVRGYGAPGLTSMKDDPDFNVTPEQESWVGSTVVPAAIVGSLAAGPMLDRMGRKLPFMFTVIIFTIGWGLVAVAEDMHSVRIGRTLCGVSIGFLTVARVTIIPEMVQFTHRKDLNPMTAKATQLGVFLSFLVGEIFTWRGQAWFGFIICIALLAMFFQVLETPYHLTRTGRRDESLATLRKIRSSASEIKTEQEHIDKICNLDSKNENKYNLRELLKHPNRVPVGAGMGLLVIQPFTGFTTVRFYASTILKYGLDGIGSGYITLIIGVVGFISTFVGLYGVGYYTRRRQIQLSTSVAVTSLITLAFFLWAEESGGNTAILAKSLRFIPVVAFIAFFLGFSFGLGCVPWVYMLEGIPSWVRGKACSVLIAAYWTAALMMGVAFQASVSTTSAHTMFIVHAVVTYFSTQLLLRFMPETSRTPTSEMDKFYLGEADKKTQ